MVDANEEGPSAEHGIPAVDFILGRLDVAEATLLKRGDLDSHLADRLEEARQNLASLDLGPLPSDVEPIYDATTLQKTAHRLAMVLGDSELDGIREISAGLSTLARTQSVSFSVDGMVAEANVSPPAVYGTGAVTVAPVAVSGSGTDQAPRGQRQWQEENVIAAAAVISLFFVAAAMAGHLGDAVLALGTLDIVLKALGAIGRYSRAPRGQR